jgi:hypothetical protein
MLQFGGRTIRSYELITQAYLASLGFAPPLTQAKNATDPIQNNRVLRSSNRRIGRSGPLTDPIVHLAGEEEREVRADTASTSSNSNIQGAATTSAIPVALPDVPPSVEEFACIVCQESFRTVLGLGQHMRHRHPVEHNAGVDVVRVKARWSDGKLHIVPTPFPECSGRTPQIVGREGVGTMPVLRSYGRRTGARL